MPNGDISEQARVSEALYTFIAETLNALRPFLSTSYHQYPLLTLVSLDPAGYRQTGITALTQVALQDRLGQLLALDSHLQHCCGSTLNLAYTLDLFFFSRFPVAPNQGDILDFQRAYKDLETTIYRQGSFRKYACFHLYNLKPHSDDPPLSQLLAPWDIRDIPANNIALLLGEQSPRSFLCPPETGTRFLVIEDAEGFDTESIQTWLGRRWKDVDPFRQILQYCKDGIVDLDFVVPYFIPIWVNQVQRLGLYYWGAPRQDVQATPYRLSSDDLARLQLMRTAYERYRTQIADFSSVLRKAIAMAGNHYEAFHKKSNREEQFANLIIAIEALYTPDDRQELTHRICQTCAAMLGSNGRERVANFDFLKEMFNRRGKLFHGQYRVSVDSPELFVTDEEILRLAGMVRRSILNWMALYLQGETQQKSIQESLRVALLDQDVGNQLRERANFDNFLAR